MICYSNKKNSQSKVLSLLTGIPAEDSLAVLLGDDVTNCVGMGGKYRFQDSRLGSPHETCPCSFSGFGFPWNFLALRCGLYLTCHRTWWDLVVELYGKYLGFVGFRLRFSDSFGRKESNQSISHVFWELMRFETSLTFFYTPFSWVVEVGIHIVMELFDN